MVAKGGNFDCDGRSSLPCVNGIYGPNEFSRTHLLSLGTRAADRSHFLEKTTEDVYVIPGTYSL
jgi:hypothetical protein